VPKAQLVRTSPLGLSDLFRVRSFFTFGFSVGLGQSSGGTTAHHTALGGSWYVTCHLSMYVSGMSCNALRTESGFISSRSEISNAVKPSWCWCKSRRIAGCFDTLIPILYFRIVYGRLRHAVQISGVRACTQAVYKC
jgi:hypothetical protein